MCKTISVKQVPDITEEEAVALVALARKSTMYSPRNTGEDNAHSVITCSIPGCGENIVLTSYPKHFSFKHKELPLKNILVTTNDGRKLSCQELFRYAIQCSLCTHVSLGASRVTRTGLKSMQNHWLRDHKEKNIEQMSFIDVMPVSSDIEKDFDDGRNMTTDEELEIEDEIYHGDVLDEVSVVPVNTVSEEDQSVADKFQDFKCPLKCSIDFTEQSGLIGHLKTFHGFNNESVKKIIKANPQLDNAGI